MNGHDRPISDQDRFAFGTIGDDGIGPRANLYVGGKTRPASAHDPRASNCLDKVHATPRAIPVADDSTATGRGQPTVSAVALSHGRSHFPVVRQARPFQGDARTMWETYIALCGQHPFLSGFVQFAVLGTIGEILSIRIRTGRPGLPFGPVKAMLKILGWGLLGVYIKALFLTAGAGIDALVAYGALPAAIETPAGTASLIARAFATSVLLNVMLGPSMMILHRLADNGIDCLLGDEPMGWRGLDRSMATLVWLWIPLHTFTFTQAKEVRIGIAALLSVVLGIVMGWFARSPSESRS
jgi:hypothetical protein